MDYEFKKTYAAITSEVARGVAKFYFENRHRHVRSEIASIDCGVEVKFMGAKRRNLKECHGYEFEGSPGKGYRLVSITIPDGYDKRMAKARKCIKKKQAKPVFKHNETPWQKVHKMMNGITI